METFKNEWRENSKEGFKLEHEMKRETKIKVGPSG